MTIVKPGSWKKLGQPAHVPFTFVGYYKRENGTVVRRTDDEIESLGYQVYSGYYRTYK